MSEQDPELSPEDEEDLRALLADLGSTGQGAEQLPAEVAARLDDVLGGLVAERAAARSRSRRRPRLAVAAAAVVVLGLGGVAVAQVGRSASESGTATDSGAGGSTAAGKPSVPSPSNLSGTSSVPPSGTASGASRSPSTFSSQQGYAAATPRLRSAAFAADVQTLVVGTSALRVPGAEDSSGTSRKAPQSALACPGPATTDGASVILVTLDSSPAALVVHPVKDGSRLVEAWSCAGTRRLASTTVAP